MTDANWADAIFAFEQATGSRIEAVSVTSKKAAEFLAGTRVYRVVKDGVVQPSCLDGDISDWRLQYGARSIRMELR